MPSVRIWLHFVWHVDGRSPKIDDDLMLKLISHIKIVANKKKIRIVELNGFRDHLHALIVIQGKQDHVDIIRHIKGESSHWINKNHLTPVLFRWQSGYHVESVSYNHVHRLKKYIRGQKEHHQNKSAAEELAQLQKRLERV